MWSTPCLPNGTLFLKLPDTAAVSWLLESWHGQSGWSDICKGHENDSSKWEKQRPGCHFHLAVRLWAAKSKSSRSKLYKHKVVVDAYRLLAHKAVVAAEYAAAVAVRLAGRLLLVVAIKEWKGGSQIELILRLEKMRENHTVCVKIETLEMAWNGQIKVSSTHPVWCNRIWPGNATGHRTRAFPGPPRGHGKALYLWTSLKLGWGSGYSSGIGAVRGSIDLFGRCHWVGHHRCRCERRGVLRLCSGRVGRRPLVGHRVRQCLWYSLGWAYFC